MTYDMPALVSESRILIDDLRQNVPAVYQEVRRAQILLDKLACLLEDLGCQEEYHVADFHENDFSLQHPLQERIEGSLFKCDVFEQMYNALDGPPALGLHRVLPDPHLPGYFLFERIS